MKLFNKNIDRREFNKLLIKSALTSFSLTMLNKDILLASDPPGGGEENSYSGGIWTDGWLVNGFYLPPIGQGYMGYGADNKRWGNNIFVNEIKSIAASWDSLGGTIGIGNISLQNGGYMAPSSSHQNGNDGDFFYVGNDFNWVDSIGSWNYSFSNSVNLMERFLNNSDINVIFTSDTTIINYFNNSKVQFWDDHYDHFHARRNNPNY